MWNEKLGQNLQCARCGTKAKMAVQYNRKWDRWSLCCPPPDFCSMDYLSKQGLPECSRKFVGVCVFVCVCSLMFVLLVTVCLGIQCTVMFRSTTPWLSALQLTRKPKCSHTPDLTADIAVFFLKLEHEHADRL